jgi:hypothetical protein
MEEYKEGDSSCVKIVNKGLKASNNINVPDER